MMTSDIQKLLLRDRRLHFISNHRAAFEVEPLYPLEIFDNFVANFDGDCTIEASCKIESDKLIAGRFLIFFLEQFEERLGKILDIFRQVESRADVQINYDLLHKFFGKSFDFSKVKRLTTGVDLRNNLADSSLKMHIVLESYPEKVDTALALDGNTSASLRSIELESVSLIGFDFYLNGRSEIELYTGLAEEQFQQPETQTFLKQIFPPPVLQPLKAADFFYVGLSKANAAPVLYYNLKEQKDLLNYFAINDTAQKVHTFYQHQAILPSMWVGVTQQELQKSRIENIRLYYYQKFSMGNK
jgi:LynF/TruF/PatF family peptide O-prenyltransferase